MNSDKQEGVGSQRCRRAECSRSELAWQRNRLDPQAGMVITASPNFVAWIVHGRLGLRGIVDPLMQSLFCEFSTAAHLPEPMWEPCFLDTFNYGCTEACFFLSDSSQYPCTFAFGCCRLSSTDYTTVQPASQIILGLSEPKIFSHTLTGSPACHLQIGLKGLVGCELSFV